MRTVIPPQFTGEDLQRLLALALAPPDADDRRSDPDLDPHPTPDPPESTDAWDESW